jgi:hypothetical protein
LTNQQRPALKAAPVVTLQLPGSPDRYMDRNAIEAMLDADKAHAIQKK